MKDGAAFVHLRTVAAICGLAALGAAGCTESTTPGNDAEADGLEGGGDTSRLNESSGAGDAEGRDEGDKDGDGEESATGVYADAWIRLLFDYVPPGAPCALLCRCEGPMPPPPVVRAEEGGCTLTDSSVPWPPIYSGICRPLDFGEIDLILDGITYPLRHADGYMDCFFSFGVDPPPPAVGDTVRLVGTGGADLPPFDVTLTIPPQVTVTEPVDGAVWTAGEPWTVRWNPPLAAHTLFVLPVGSRTIRCESTAASPVAVPASITALWDAFDTSGTVNFEVIDSAVVPGEPPLALEAGWGYVPAAVDFARSP